MRRREAKFVDASPRMSPDQVQAAPRLREDRPQLIGKVVREKGSRAVIAVRRPQDRNQS